MLRENSEKGFKETRDLNKIDFNFGSINSKTSKRNCFEQSNNLFPNNPNE